MMIFLGVAFYCPRPFGKTQCSMLSIWHGKKYVPPNPKLETYLKQRQTDQSFVRSLAFQTYRTHCNILIRTDFNIIHNIDIISPSICCVALSFAFILLNKVFLFVDIIRFMFTFLLSFE